MLRRLLAALLLLVVLLAVAVVLFARGIIGGDTLRRTLEDQLSARVGRPVRIARLGASFVPRVTLDLHDVTIGQPPAAGTGAGSAGAPAATISELSVATGLRGLLSRRVEDAEVIVANSRLPVPVIVGIAGAVASGPAEPASEAGSGFTIVSVRRLVFRQVELVAEPHSLLFDLESSLQDDRLEVTRLTAESAGTTLDVRGSLTSVARRAGTFSATASRLNLDELLAVASSLSASIPAAPGAPAAAAPSEPSALDLTVELTAPGGELAGYAFEALSSTLRVTPDHLRLQPLRFTIFGGRYDGALNVSPAAATTSIALDGTVSTLDVARMLRETRGSTSLSGTMAASFSLTSRGSTSAALLEAAGGSGSMTITSGTVPGLEMVRAVVLGFGKPSGARPPGSGSAFTKIEGAFTLADQTLSSKDITFASRDFDMAGSAVVSLRDGALDVRANVRLSPELTAQAGTDLRRYAQENGRVVVPATIGGTLAAPRISIDVAAALNRALQNEVRRKLKGLLDRIIK